ncbi:inactive protein RESTRICTED TEV MOVEMENT 2-like [Aristolochia californica]|uniref:inactive protein RESTRICTED TEV MOVEMENT 2-like n=1 Tax=Aristolochia californica TaxID=171875 RepID=UPI0035E2A1CF
MDADGNSNRVYVDFQPQYDWVRESGSNTLVIDLPGFKKDQLKVQLDSLGNLKIGGERPVADNKWTRFRNDFPIPENSNLNEIRAKFEKGTLFVNIPTTITQIIHSPKQSPPQAQSPPQPQAPPPTPQKPTQKDETEKKTKDEAVINGRQTEQKSKTTLPETDVSKVMSGREEKSSLMTAAETSARGASSKPGRTGPVQGLLAKKPNQLVVNVVVSFLVVVGIAVYMAYKFKAATKERN